MIFGRFELRYSAFRKAVKKERDGVNQLRQRVSSPALPVTTHVTLL